MRGLMLTQQRRSLRRVEVERAPRLGLLQPTSTGFRVTVRLHDGQTPDDYERVLDKLRYMRGSEPLPGYDALSAQEIVTALERADPATIKKVRGYERKFAKRPSVLEAVVRAHHQGLEDRPARPAPAYQPMSAPPRGDRSKTRAGP